MSLTVKFICLCCLVSISFAAACMPDSDANIHVGRQDSIISVSATITLPLAPCEAYGLLTDYNNLSSYVPGILETHYERTAKNMVKVWQTGEVGILFFHVRMKSLLEMEEISNRRILFRQLEGDLESYSGEWDFEPAPEGTRIVYMSALTFKHYVPAFLAKSILEDEIGRRFAAIATEAKTRKGKMPSACVEGK